MNRIRTAIAAGLVALPLYALAQGVPGMPGHDMGAMDAAPPAGTPEAEFMDAHQAMMVGMSVPLTGNVDRDFLTMMIPHHQGAIAMAEVYLRHGSDPQIRALAEAIVTAQEKEIADMETWLAAHPP